VLVPERHGTNDVSMSYHICVRKLFGGIILRKLVMKDTTPLTFKEHERKTNVSNMNLVVRKNIITQGCNAWRHFTAALQAQNTSCSKLKNSQKKRKTLRHHRCILVSRRLVDTY